MLSAILQFKRDTMSIPGISAGTGPAAFVVGGVIMVLLGFAVGWVLVVTGGALSAFWALKFK